MQLGDEDPLRWTSLTLQTASACTIVLSLRESQRESGYSAHCVTTFICSLERGVIFAGC